MALYADNVSIKNNDRNNNNNDNSSDNYNNDNSNYDFFLQLISLVFTWNTFFMFPSKHNKEAPHQNIGQWAQETYSFKQKDI